MSRAAFEAWYDAQPDGRIQPWDVWQAAVANTHAELAKPVDITTEMAAVADRFAHKLALDLECVLADYSGTWYDTAMTTLGAYREAMNAIHERESPTFMGEPLLPAEGWEPLYDKAALDAAVAAERKRCVDIIERYRVPVGNSSAGEMAAEWTIDALKAIRDEIRKGE